MLLYVVIIGAVAGLIHQLVDRAKENDRQAVVRGMIVGAVAGCLSYLMYPLNTDVIYLVVFTSGYFGDSVILNIVERYKVEA